MLKKIKETSQLIEDQQIVTDIDILNRVTYNLNLLRLALHE